jgi:hypothetical protein
MDSKCMASAWLKYDGSCDDADKTRRHGTTMRHDPGYSREQAF